MTGSSFVGADPAGLVMLATTAEQLASRIGGAAVDMARISGQPGGRADATIACLVKIDRRLDEQAQELRWRSSAIEEAQLAAPPLVLGPNRDLVRKADFASNAVFELDSWQEAFAQWRGPPPLSQLLKMTPQEVAEAFAELDPATAEALTARFPGIVGRLDGAPPRLRYLANDLLVYAEIDRLEFGLAMLEDPLSPRDLRALGIGGSGRGPVASGLIAAVASALSERANEYRRWLAEDRQILLFDPAGDGRAVEVFGDLDVATHVGVVVPGMANSIENFSHIDGGFRDNAADLLSATSGIGRVATVAWLGYDSPDSLGAVTRSAANEGAPALIRFLEGLSPDQTVTVVAHSYGSVVAGTAARSGIAADNLVFVGSPGTTLDHAGDAQLRSGGRVWSALAEGDPIVWGIAPRELPWWVLLPNPILTVGGLIGGFDAPRDLWHGTNPALTEFGATRIDTDGSSGHSSYFEATTLDNLAAIVEGDYTAVEMGS